LPEQRPRAVVLDTDVASRSFKGQLPAAYTAGLLGVRPLVTFVTVGELTQSTRLRQWSPRSRAMLESWLVDKPGIPAGKSIAVRWGELSAAATRRGRPQPVNDTWIAACCLAYGVPLMTFNMNDFIGFAQYDGLSLFPA
jgi:predicted nucleic acid-binding protein